jgi:DNA polymerase I-like protein with 3'-5' exonuclease and polymerase domains
MIRVHKLLSGTMSRLVMPIHDEIVMYMHKPDIKMLPTIIEEMENFDFRVPIVADICYSTTNWNEKQELILS